MTPLQKRALYEFTAAITMMAVLLPLISFAGIGLETLVALMIIAGGLVYWVPRYLTRPKPDQPVIMDERDKAILSNVPRYQSIGIVLTIVTWLIILSILYEDQGQVPFRFLNLMWISVITANAVFYTAGVMIEYWRAKSGFTLTAKWVAGIVVVLVLGFVMAWTLGPKESTVPTCRIKPRFTSTHTQANVGVPVRFIDTSVGDANAWIWNFGDSTYSNEQNPTHTYSSPGQYTVELWVGCSGGSGVDVKEEGYITVQQPGSP